MCCLICQVRVPAKAPIKFSTNSDCRFEDAALSGAGKLCAAQHHAVARLHHAIVTLQQPQKLTTGWQLLWQNNHLQ